MRILPCNANDPQLMHLLAIHRGGALILSPEESGDISATLANAPYWGVWEEAHGSNRLLGFGALRELSPDHGEVKSMHTAEAARRRGVGRMVLRHILTIARQRGYSRVSLETGSRDLFAPARALYHAHGFVACGPFGDYADDPLSIFMTLNL